MIPAGPHYPTGQPDPARTVRDILQWDVRSWHRALRFWERHIQWERMQRGLELGGREGGLSLWMALNGLESVCSDLEHTADTAAPLHARYGLTDRITYRDIDATDIPYQDHFDLIAFKSILGGIGRDGRADRQQATLRQIHKALKPGGLLVFAENMAASPLHRLLRKHFVDWGGSWRYVHLEEMPGLLSSFTSHELRCTGVLATLGRNERQRRLLARADRGLLGHLVPDRWKYIAYGVAVK